MDMIELARDFGRELQKDERYLAFDAARVASDADEELQALIGEFNLKRMAINNEAQKDEQDEEKSKPSTKNCVLRITALWPMTI